MTTDNSPPYSRVINLGRNYGGLRNTKKPKKKTTHKTKTKKKPQLLSTCHLLCSYFHMTFKVIKESLSETDTNIGCIRKPCSKGYKFSKLIEINTNSVFNQKELYTDNYGIK